ncbi:MAG: outer membrane beta-barrel protein [Rhizobiales bacterium]|nr:outer membrane beta-barrel protein [Hyphomicrobiales bacterium]
MTTPFIRKAATLTIGCNRVVKNLDCSTEATALRFADSSWVIIRPLAMRKGSTWSSANARRLPLPRRHRVTASRIAHRFLLASAALVMAAPEVALAQQAVDPNTTVADRARPEYDALGIRAGSFLVFPELGVTEAYSDNVAFAEEDEQSDFVTEIEPSLRFQSQWSRHLLVAEIGSEIAIHADESDEDFQDLFAVGRGQVDVSRQTNITANAQARRGHEGRDDPEDAGNDELTDLYQYGGGAAFNHQINRVGFSAGAEVLRSVYDDDGEEDRNANIYDFLLRTSYEVSPRLDLFVEGRYNIEDRDDAVDDAGIDRNTSGYEARLGAGLDITSVLFGEAFAGYRVQDFDEDDFDEETGVSFGVDLNWNPTLLTSIGLSGQRDFRPTDEGGAASNFQTEFAVTIDHELLRNLIMNGEARYQNDDFKGDDREDET